jgi:hypothetical protein
MSPMPPSTASPGSRLRVTDSLAPAPYDRSVQRRGWSTILPPPSRLGCCDGGGGATASQTIALAAAAMVDSSTDG